MSDFEDVSEYEAPLDIETLIKMMQKLAKREGPIGFMDLCLMDDDMARNEMVQDGNLSQEEAEVLSYMGRLQVIDIDMDTGRLSETPKDYPYYIAMEEDNEVYIIFFKDKRLAKLIDWRT